MSALPKALAGLVGGYATWKYLDGKYQLSRDIHDIKKILPGIIHVAKTIKDPEGSLIKYWYTTLAKPGQVDKVMIISADDGRKLTFGDVEAMSNRVAHWALSKGWKPGTAVSVMMDNRPEFTPLWLGLAKVGVVAAFINTNLRGKPMTHAISAASAVAAIFGTEHAEVAQESLDVIREGGVQTVISYGSGGPAGKALPDGFDESLDMSLQGKPEDATDHNIWKNRGIQEACFFIYTSGTTGLPKACKMSHYKLCAIAPVTCPMFELLESDIIYSSGLPLYHGAANIGVLAAITIGCTVCNRVKFSASQHWEDCATHNVTAMQYIGELCRYLLAQPSRPAEAEHKIRIAFGNGLRPEIWNEFQRRFHIPEIGEIYGATEANSGCYNHCKNYEGQGAVGRAGAILSRMFATKIVRYNVEEDDVVRDPQTGLCMECEYDEVGELVAPIRTLDTANGKMDNFEGYTNKEATEKKILRDVFTKGDQYFRSGDLLRRDNQGFFYFVDRIGDTFRWKGENVSTMEVSEVISSLDGVVDANVLGVQVPGKDGRAGMVVLTTEDGTVPDADFRQQLATHCKKNLPTYSIPVFVRLVSGGMNITGTFKHQKVEYRNQGCDPSSIEDEMWWYNASSSNYEPYGNEEYTRIIGGHSKL